MKPTPASTSSPRLTSLDAYRGFVMILLVSGGGLGLERLRASSRFSWIARELEHREWAGCSVWDLVQPAFMFIVGVAMPLAAAQRAAPGSYGRALKLCALGMLLDAWQRGHFALQFISVLQQIAFAYAFVSILLAQRPRTQASIAAALLGVHTLAFVAYGHLHGIGPWSRADNVGVAIDRALHLPIDPEGYVTFNAVSSTATVIFGALAGQLLQSALSPGRKAKILAAAGALGIAFGLAASAVVPMVKHIWTASFGLYASGWVCVSLALFYAAVDVKKIRGWTKPLIVVGTNSIAIYVFSELFSTSLRGLFRPLAGAMVATLIVIGIKWLLCYVLYVRRIFIKV